MKIGIVDDHVIIHEGLKILLKEKGYDITFEAYNGADMIEQFNKIQKDKIPEIVIMDIQMPIMDGFEAVQWLKKNHKEIKIMVFSMVGTEDSIIRMLKLGVESYVPKWETVDEILKAFTMIKSEGKYFTREIANILVNNLQNSNNADQLLSIKILSENEIKFVKLACSELTYSEIATKMGLSTRTIDGYRENIFLKLKLKSRVGLAIYAIKKGLIKV